MIVELASLQVAAERAADFENIFPKAQAVLRQSAGLYSSRLLHDVDHSGSFTIEVHWESVEHHTEGFARSELFEQFKAIVGSYLQGPPAVHHFTVVADPGPTDVPAPER